MKAQQFAKYVNPEYRGRIAFLEEPCKTRDDSRAFSRETGIAIAWDESLREADFTFEAEEGVKAVVIKPTLTGSLDDRSHRRDQLLYRIEPGLNPAGAHCCLVDATDYPWSGYAQPDAVPAGTRVAWQYVAVH